MSDQIGGRLVRWVAVACFFAMSAAEASRAAGDPSTSRQIAPEGGKPRSVYQRMSYQGLTISVPDQVRGLPQTLQVVESDALRFIYKKIRLDTRDKSTASLTLPEELVGQPGLLVQPRIVAAWEARFHIDRPARLYA